MRRHAIRLAALLFILTFGCYTAAASAEMPANGTPLNVIANFNNEVPVTQAANTQVFTGSTWRFVQHHAKLFRTSRGIRLRLLKGERVMHAYADYGTKSDTLVSAEITWGGKGALPLTMQVTADGQVQRLSLTSVTVEIIQPRRPVWVSAK